MLTGVFKSSRRGNKKFNKASWSFSTGRGLFEASEDMLFVGKRNTFCYDGLHESFGLVRAWCPSCRLVETSYSSQRQRFLGLVVLGFAVFGILLRACSVKFFSKVIEFFAGCFFFSARSLLKFSPVTCRSESLRNPLSCAALKVPLIE